jgi:hypothetical protein
MRLPSHVGHGVILGAPAAVVTKPGRAEYWQVGQIIDAFLCRCALDARPNLPA